MNFMRIATISLLLLGIGTRAQAFDPTPQRGQLSGKIFAVTVVHGCPTEELIGHVLEEGIALGADYTELPEVVAASLCPATRAGRMWSWHQVDDEAAGFTAQMLGGVVIGLHYRITR